MFVRRVLFWSSAAALGLGLAGVPAAVWADDAPSPASPTVSQTAGTFVVTLPGVGSLSFGVDPTTGALTGLTVTPAAGTDFTAGTPQLTDEGVQVLFSGTTGSQLLEVEVEEGPMPEVTAEVKAPDAADDNEVAGAGAPGEVEDGGQSVSTGEDHGTSGDDQPPVAGVNQSGDNQSGEEVGDNDQSGDNQSGAQTTTTTTVPTSQGTGTSGGDGQGQSGDGQSSDGGSDGSGSGGSGSGDGGSDGGGSGGSSGSDG